MTTSATRFQLGNFSFRLKTNRTDMLNAFAKVLPQASNQESDSAEAIDLDVPLAMASSSPGYDPQEDATIAMHYLIGHAINSHPGCIWVDAAALIAPEGKLVMLNGASCAGKTTLTLAMAKAHGWKVLSEDLVVIDTTRGTIIPIVRPSSLRAGTRQLIFEATGILLEPVISDQWYLDESMYHSEPTAMPISLAVNLDVIDSANRGNLDIRSVAYTDYLRSVLPVSNALRVTSGVEALGAVLREAQCFSFTGGTVMDRMRELVSLVVSPRGSISRSEL